MTTVRPPAAICPIRLRMLQWLQTNPDEGLNADLKQNVTRQAPLRTKQQLKQAAISHMHRLSNSPARVRSFFRQKSMRYAA